MHLVLRSSKATGEWSFRRAKNRRKIETLLTKFSRRFAVGVLSMANVGNHLHLHVQLTNRFTYKPFIRALTASIAMAITGRNKWTRQRLGRVKFWDYRPYTRVIVGLRALLGLRDYIRINTLEGYGYSRHEAVYWVRRAQRLFANTA
jgi:REP element-mobilizing transposase RayT